MNSAFIYHTSCLLRSTKDEKGGKQMAKQINYKKKNHVTCQIYTLLYVAVFFPPTSSHCRNWILKNLYIINTLHAPSTYRVPPLRCFVSTKSNILFVYVIHALFTFTLARHEIQKRVPLNSYWVALGRKKSDASILPFKPLKGKKETNIKKEPHEVGLRGWAENSSCGLVGKKIHMKSFHIRSD